MSRPFQPPSLSSHPSGRYWGRPPPRRQSTPVTLRPSTSSKSRAEPPRNVEPTRSICEEIDESDLHTILRDLCYWQSYVSTIEELRNRITTAAWYPLILLKLAETTGVFSGAPNSGKSSLVVNLATSLGLTRTKTTSKNFWLYARNSRPYFSLWLYCTDSFSHEQDPLWSKMAQSINSVSKSEEFETGAIFIEGHRIFDYDQYADLSTSVFHLASSDPLMILRGTSGDSVRRHKLHLSKHLDALPPGLTVLDAEQSKVSLLCRVLQVLHLEDANLDASHLRGELELDARWSRWLF